jgi:hypothetical protein
MFIGCRERLVSDCVNVRGEALEFLARHRRLFGVPLL